MANSRSPNSSTTFSRGSKSTASASSFASSAILSVDMHSIRRRTQLLQRRFCSLVARISAGRAAGAVRRQYGGAVLADLPAKDKDSSTKEHGRSSDRKVLDCAICMNEIDVPVVSKASGKERSGMGSSWLERRNYMVTPCRHIFHSECLEGWMRLRLSLPYLSRRTTAALNGL